MYLRIAAGDAWGRQDFTPRATLCPRTRGLTSLALFFCLLLCFEGLLGAATTISSSPNPSVLGDRVTLTATVSPTASGSVAFFDGATFLGIAPIASGRATLTTVLLPFGNRLLRAEFAGALSAPVTQTVTARAGNGFAPVVSYISDPTANSMSMPQAVEIGDFNGDGKADLVVANSFTHSLSVFTNNASGTFGNAAVYDQKVNGNLELGTRSVALGDFNGDGIADLAAANSDAGTVTVMLGRADGTFSKLATPIDYPVGTNPRAVVVADFNGDGLADIAVANNDGHVTILLGFGNGTFQVTSVIQVTPGPEALAIGDFNADGKADLVVGGNTGGTGTVTVLLGRGDGTFTVAGAFPAGRKTSCIAVGYLNADGNADLVVGNYDDNTVMLFSGNGNGTFRPPTDVYTGAGATSGIESVVVGDFNGDGIGDLAVGSIGTPTGAGNGGVTILLGQGDGTFVLQTGTTPLPTGPAKGSSPHWLAVGDFNGDGTTDIVAANRDFGTIGVLLGTPNFSTTRITVTTSPPGLAITVDAVTYTSPQTFNWAASSMHSIAVSSPQPGVGTQYLFASWSDGLAQNHGISTPASPTTYTASFTTQYQLTTSAATGGSISPTSGFYNSGTIVGVNATASSGYQFNGFSGDLTATTTPQNVIVSAPKSIGANFTSIVSGITLTTMPAGLSITVDNVNYTAPQSFQWIAGSSHSIAVNSPQSAGAETQYLFASWSDGLAQSHGISTPASPTTYTASFTTQYQLTTSAATGGSISPASRWNNSGSVVSVSATANSGYQFNGFSGDLTGTTTPQNVIMSAPKSIAANFTPIVSGITVTTVPAGLSITVDNLNYTSPQTFQWTSGSSHTIGVSNTQIGPAGTRYLWSSWSDGGSLTHTFNVGNQPTTYTANFTTQYLLTLAASPIAGGTLAASPSSSDGYYNSGVSVQITATANPGYQFTNFSGDFSGTTNPQSVAMSAARSVAGNFNTATLSLDQTHLYFSNVNGIVTSPQTVHVAASPGVNWTAASNQPNIIVSPSSGAGNGSFQISVNPGSSGVVTVNAPKAINSPQQIQVSIANPPASGPFGNFDTPVNNTAGISGAIAVTGWALDNVEVSNVDIWREKIGSEPVNSNGLVSIGNAIFVAGARPDVEAANPSVPFNYRGGWGYLLLTNYLPNSDGSTGFGNGTYKLHAIAHNKAGAQTDLGTKTITVDNAHASKPFGTIDTPDQGGTMSGNSYVNFGWALAQNPSCIPKDGSTITVMVDGIALGHPSYNQFRSDVAGLFPGLCNSSGAVGYYNIDSTQLSNGAHTISWVVYDSANRGGGIGSRYFNVFSASSTARAAVSEEVTGQAVRGVRARLGYDANRPAEQLAEGEAGVYAVETEELGRIELQVGARSGYMTVQGQRRPLPVGSTLKGGTFYWQLGPAFFGEYPLTFDRPGGTQVRVRVVVRPKAYSEPKDQ